jgi:hypothetical protein
MEFLDINVIKDESILLHAIHNPFYDRRISKKTILFTGFKNAYKKIREKRGDSSLWPEPSTKNAVQEFHLWICRLCTVTGFAT